MKSFKPGIGLSGSLVVLIGISLSGCFRDCDFQSEPSLSLSIHNGVVYTTGYALKGHIPLEGYANAFTLPVSLNDDRMIYTFQSSEGTDTLEVIYTKEVAYKDLCGFTLKLTDMQAGELTTFETVDFSDKSIDVQ